nr:prolyl oligopeptidase family serine peptidase [Candidatus Sigynarchaeota archaeon]
MQKLDLKRLLNVLSIVLVVLNAFTIFGGTWSLAVPSGTVFDSIIDILLGATIGMNLFFVIVGYLFLDYKKDKQAARINWYLSGYLIGSCFMLLTNFLFTLVVALSSVRYNIVYGTMLTIAITLNAITHVFPIFAGIAIYKTTVPSSRALSPVIDEESWVRKPSFIKVIKCIGIPFIFLVFAMSIYLPMVFFSSGHQVQYWIAGDLAITMVFFLLPMTLMLVRYMPRTKRKQDRALRAIFAIAGFVLAGINAIPLVQIQGTVTSIDQQFTVDFGAGWESTIPQNIRTGFRTMPLSLKDMMFTLPIGETDELHDIVYTMDKGQSLKFDWYGPKGITSTANSLPVIIAIHGGSWELYDKGIYNTLPTTLYLASKGYIVVDIQYGLFDEGDSDPYSLKDMILEIANLTTLLESNAGLYHVNMSKVYFMGRSAGAHLSLTAGLGYDNPFFAGNFSATMTCRGIIPFYPPTNMSSWYDASDVNFFGVPFSQFHYFNPVDLVSATSPPVLCFEGLADRLVSPTQVYMLDDAMAAMNKTCITGLFPNVGHEFDIFYNYACNQVCLYYIERFLAFTSA